MLKIFFLSAAAVNFCACFAFAQVEIQEAYWITDLTAKAKVVESSIGTNFNLKSDLGVKDEDFPETRCILYTGKNSKMRLAYAQVNYSGEQTITQSIDFKGKTYTASTLVKSELDIQYFRLGWINQFVNLLDERVKFGTIVELKGISADMSLETPNLLPAINESESFIGGLPTLGAALDIKPIEKINLFAEISGLPAGDFGYFFDAEAGAKIIPIKYFILSIGYRILDIKAEDDPNFIRLKIAGPFFSGTLKF